MLFSYNFTNSMVAGQRVHNLKCQGLRQCPPNRVLGRAAMTMAHNADGDDGEGLERVDRPGQNDFVTGH
jgi:hypothetical protein